MWDSLKNLQDKFHENIEEMQKLRGLRIWIIHVLDDGPKNGVEIMDSIQEHFEQMHQMRGMENIEHRSRHLHHTIKHASRPSPGSVYPLLKKMVDENLISKGDDGRYELTSRGQEISHKLFGHLRRFTRERDPGAFAVKNALTEIDGYVSYLEDIKKEKLILHEGLIGDLCERLDKIKESLYED
ncbi:MAG TPA: hypothetical protein VF324_02845 [Methanobacterium sp.]